MHDGCEARSTKISLQHIDQFPFSTKVTDDDSASEEEDDDVVNDSQIAINDSQADLSSTKRHLRYNLMLLYPGTT